MGKREPILATRQALSVESTLGLQVHDTAVQVEGQVAEVRQWADGKPCPEISESLARKYLKA